MSILTISEKFLREILLLFFLGNSFPELLAQKNGGMAAVSTWSKV
jgi:hypothetical protein